MQLQNLACLAILLAFFAKMAPLYFANNATMGTTFSAQAA